MIFLRHTLDDVEFQIIVLVFQGRHATCVEECSRREINCNGTCFSKRNWDSCPSFDNTDFRCYNGECIKAPGICDGKKDCEHGEDEINCPNLELDDCSFINDTPTAGSKITKRGSACYYFIIFAGFLKLVEISILP